MWRAIRRCIRARTKCSARTITAITILWRRWSSRRAGAVPSRWRPSKHDDQGGALRGTNTIHVLAAEGLRVVHLGDLGHELSGEQLAPLRGCDTLLIPVGGFYTIDAETAKRVADAIAPRVIVPMHYRHGSHGYDVIATVEDFLRLYPADEVHCLDGSSFELTPDAPRGVIVPKFMG